MVFQRSMLDWRREWGQSAIGICALHYIYPDLPSLVYHYSRHLCSIDLGVGSISHGYICIVLYMRCMCVMDFQRSLLDCRRGVICYRYMCMLLYVQLIGCNGVA